MLNNIDKALIHTFIMIINPYTINIPQAVLEREFYGGCALGARSCSHPQLQPYPSTQTLFLRHATNRRWPRYRRWLDWGSRPDHRCLFVFSHPVSKHPCTPRAHSCSVVLQCFVCASTHQTSRLRQSINASSIHASSVHPRIKHHHLQIYTVLYLQL